MHALALAFQPTAAAQPAPVRVQTDADGTVWFCGSDVATALGYRNTRDALAKHCRQDEKGVAIRDTLTPGGTQSLTFITEPNVYRLIVRSRRPEAEAFERWVFEEVLPAIRRTGRYGTSDVDVQALAARVADLAGRVEQLEAANAALVRRMLPSASPAGLLERTRRRAHTVGRSGFFGVDEKRPGVWRARVWTDGRYVVVAYCAAAEDAARAYDGYIRLHLLDRGLYARPLNFPADASDAATDILSLPSA